MDSPTVDRKKGNDDNETSPFFYRWSCPKDILKTIYTITAYKIAQSTRSLDNFIGINGRKQKNPSRKTEII